jgi:hypothetical protein
VHAIEYGWLDVLRTVELYAYRLPADPFEVTDAALVATTEVAPLGPPERVGNLFELDAAAGIQLRVLPHLHDGGRSSTSQSAMSDQSFRIVPVGVMVKRLAFGVTGLPLMETVMLSTEPRVTRIVPG